MLKVDSNGIGQKPTAAAAGIHLLLPLLLVTLVISLTVNVMCQ